MLNLTKLCSLHRSPTSSKWVPLQTGLRNKNVLESYCAQAENVKGIIENITTDRLVPPLNGTVPARRGTAAAATRRAAPCTSRSTPPGLAAPPPRRAPWHRPTGRAAAWRGVLGTSRRAATTRSTRSTGRLRPSGVAAGLPAARAPWAPAADPSGHGPSLAAAGPARTRLRTQRSRLGLGGVFALRIVFVFASSALRPKMCRLQIMLLFHLLGAFFSSIFSSKTKGDKTKNIKNIFKKNLDSLATPTYDCSLVAFDMLVESRFECFPAWVIESWHGRMSGTSLGGGVGH